MKSTDKRVPQSPGAEGAEHETSMTAANDLAVRRAFRGRRRRVHRRKRQRTRGKVANAATEKGLGELSRSGALMTDELSGSCHRRTIDGWRAVLVLSVHLSVPMPALRRCLT